MSEQSLILLSGGVDSTVLAYWLESKGYNFGALTYDFGQSVSETEIKSAKKIAGSLNIKHYIIKNTVSSKRIRNSMLIYAPNRHKSETENLISAVTVGYALIFSSVFGMFNKISHIYLAVQKQDLIYFPGFGEKYLFHLESMLFLWTGKKIKIFLPFYNKKKSSIIKLGTNLGVIFKNTWSCGCSGSVHCGKCKDCIERKMAFCECNITDNTKYRHYGL
jgi:7-cyano-7-deazaguanine synthase